MVRRGLQLELRSAVAVHPEDFKTGVVERLHAMARSYELLSRESWKEASIRELFAIEVAPFGSERVVLEGAEIRLSPRQALSVATNAGKYGSLRAEKGRLNIRWEVRRVGGADQVSVVWRESGGRGSPKRRHRASG